MAITHAVRPMRSEEVASVSRVLARAFDDDPVMAWLFPDAATRPAKLARFFTMDVASVRRRDGQILTTDGHEGAAVWAAPGRWKVGGWELVRNGPTSVRILGRQLPTGLRGLSMIEREHPREHHWYLGALGTDPPRQGTGVGGALMAPVLERCDREGLGAYLESSKERNVPYYERFGFRVTKEVDMPKGPKIWLMWRDPGG